MDILVLGASGSAGGSVLQACLASPRVREVRTIGRRRLDIQHAKLREFVHSNFEDYTGVQAAFAGVAACLFCLGKSVRQVPSADEYRRITYDFALAAAGVLREQAPDAVFHYISGSGTHLDSRFMWARVKAEAERDLIARFNAVCWRPASIDGMPSASEPAAYKAFRPVARVLLQPFRSLYVKGEDIGLAMLQATIDGVRGRIVDNAEIRELADRARTVTR